MSPAAKSAKKALSAAFSLAKTTCFSLAPLAALLAVFETGARIHEWFSPPLSVDAGLGFSERSRVFVPSGSAQSGTMTTAKSKQNTFVAQEFRQPKPRGVFRIAVLGESSVFFLEDDLLAMAAALGKETRAPDGKVEIINAGGKSYGSQRLLSVARELAGYDLDLAIVYIGNNEFEELEQLQYYVPGTVAAQEWLGNLAFFRLLRDSVARVRIARIQKEHDEYILSEEPRDAGHNFHVYSQEDDLGRMRAFRANLSQIIEVFRGIRIPVVVGTIPSNIVEPHLFKQDRPRYAVVEQLLRQGSYAAAARLGRDVLSHYSNRRQSSDVENGIIRETSARPDVTFVDIDRLVSLAEPHGIPGETLFLDHCHLTGPGRAIWIGAMKKAIVTTPEFEAWASQSRH